MSWASWSAKSEVWFVSRQHCLQRLDTPAYWEAFRLRAQQYHDTLQRGGTLYFAGNGGSAAICQHIAAEYVGRFVKERGPYRAVALTTDTSILTAVGNDYGFEQVFARQVAALCTSNDLLILHSTSGKSSNLIHATRAAPCPVLGLLGGDGGPLLPLCSHVILAPGTAAAEIQEAHLAIEHLLCHLVEGA